MSSSVFRIVEDNPPRRMHLVSSSGPPRRYLRALGWVLLPGIPLLAVTTFYQLFWHDFVLAAQRDPGAKFTFYFVLVLGGIMLLTATQMVGKIVARATGYLHEVTLDADAGRIETRYRGWLWWHNRGEQVALEQIKRLIVTTGPNVTLPVVELEVEFEDEAAYNDQLVMSGQIERVEDRQAAVEWAFRVASVCGLAGYGIRRNDEQDLEVLLTRQAPAKSKYLPLPSNRSGERFKLPPPKDIVAQAAARTGRFDPESLAECAQFTKIETWQPGEHVRFVHPAIPGGAVVVLGVLAGGVAAVVAAFPLYEFLSGLLVEAPRWAYALAAGFAVGLLAAYVAVTRFRYTERAFDWGRREVHLVDGRQERLVGFNHIEGLLLRGVRSDGNLASSSRRLAQRRATYRSRLEMMTSQRNYVLIEVDQFDSQPTRAQRRLAPLAQELATALECDWHWEGYDRGTAAVRYERWKMRPLEMVCLLLIGLGVASSFAWRGHVRRATEQAVADVELTGVKTSFTNGYTFHHIEVLRDYWSIDFEERGDDQRVREVAEKLKELPRVVVDLTGSPITDDSLLSLSEVPHLQVLYLSNTPVTDRGLARLASSDELVMLSATRTAMTDDVLAEIAKLPRLRILLIGFNPITDEGLRHLQQCPSLEWLHVVHTNVTRAGIVELQQARPHLHIEH